MRLLWARILVKLRGYLEVRVWSEIDDNLFPDHDIVRFRWKKNRLVVWQLFSPPEKWELFVTHTPINNISYLQYSGRAR